LTGLVSTSWATSDTPSNRHSEGVEVDNAVHAETLGRVYRQIRRLVGRLPLQLNLDGLDDLLFKHRALR
jgi:hypothetical protein